MSQVSDFRAFLARLGNAHQYSDAQLSAALRRAQTHSAPRRYEADDEAEFITAADHPDLPFEEEAAAVDVPPAPPADPGDYDDAGLLHHLGLERLHAEKIAQEMPQAGSVSRADFHYREAEDGGDAPERCRDCKFYGEEVMPDRLGTCKLFEELSLADGDRFNLAPDIGNHMVCDAFEEGDAEDDPFQWLAEHYADTWNALEASGRDIPEEELNRADAQLSGTGWGINWDDEKDMWEVAEYPEQFGAERSPRGGVTINGKFYKGGQWIPSGVASSKEGRKKIKEAKEQAAKPAEEKRDDGLEPVFSKGHNLHDRIFYDPKEGKYYDKGSDLYLSLEEAAAFGIGPKGEKPATEKEEKKPESHWGSKEQPYWHPGKNPTVDNVVTRTNPDTGEEEVLLIQRKEGGAEGGKWALPGGHHDTDASKGDPWKAGHETSEEAALRELKEETGLDSDQLKGGMKHVGEYEGGGRDPRDNDEAWSASSVFKVHLTPEQAKAMADVKGQDDAQAAKWVPVKDLGKMDLAFDHGKMLQDAGVEPSTEYGQKGMEPKKPTSGPSRWNSIKPGMKVETGYGAVTIKEIRQEPNGDMTIVPAEDQAPFTVSASNPPDLAGGWVNNLADKQTESVFAAMRGIRERADAAMEQARKLQPRQGTIGVGGADFDEILKGESLNSFLRHLNKGKTPEDALDEAKQDARAMIEHWNKNTSKGRMKVASQHELDRWEGAADAGLLGAYLSVTDSAKSDTDKAEDWKKRREDMLNTIEDLRHPPDGTGPKDQAFRIQEANRLEEELEKMGGWGESEPPAAKRSTPAKGSPERIELEAKAKQNYEERERIGEQLDKLRNDYDSTKSEAKREKMRAQRDQLMERRAALEKEGKPYKDRAHRASLEDLMETGDEAQKAAARGAIAEMDGDREGYRKAYDEVKDMAIAEAKAQGLNDEDARFAGQSAASMMNSYPHFNKLKDQVRIEVGRAKTSAAKRQASEDLDNLKDLSAGDRGYLRDQLDKAGSPEEAQTVLDRAKRFNDEQRTKRQAERQDEERRAADKANQEAFSHGTSSVKTRALKTPASLVKYLNDPKKVGMHKNWLGIAAETGWVTDGRMLFKAPEAEKPAIATAAAAGPNYDKQHAAGFAKKMEGVFPKKVDKEAAEVVGSRDRDGKPEYMLRSPSGEAVAVDANLFETIRSRYPKATLHLAKSKLGGYDGPVSFKVGDETVGLLMPLSDKKPILRKE